ncbi:MAG: hypothetical protein QNJ69_09455 [Gammaproteobacteria bacterium]|nr:hypothetical protein [Gammaproteobacteria bacterium]
MDKTLAIGMSACISCLVSTTLLAQSDFIELKKDPFSQPDILKYQPPVAVTRQRLDEDPDEIPQLRLTATLISVSEPMVIVNDELLHVGDEIEGMRLILIDEGRAIFRYQGETHEITLDESDDEVQEESEE